MQQLTIIIFFFSASHVVSLLLKSQVHFRQQETPIYFKSFNVIAFLHHSACFA